MQLTIREAVMMHCKVSMGLSFCSSGSFCSTRKRSAIKSTLMWCTNLPIPSNTGLSRADFGARFSTPKYIWNSASKSCVCALDFFTF